MPKWITYSSFHRNTEHEPGASNMTRYQVTMQSQHIEATAVVYHAVSADAAAQGVIACWESLGELSCRAISVEAV